MATLPADVRPANPAHDLFAVRAAFVERVNAAADRALTRDPMAGMPSKLAAASCYLAAHGATAQSCPGEAFFNWSLTTSRDYLAGLDPVARDAEIEAGRVALFEGRHPIAVSAAEQPQTAEIVDLDAVRRDRRPVERANPSIGAMADNLGSAVDRMIAVQMAAYPAHWSAQDRRAAAKDALFGRGAA